MFKIPTSILPERSYNFLEHNNLLPDEQKRFRRESYGCKDQLLINKIAGEDAKSKKKNIQQHRLTTKKHLTVSLTHG